MKFPTIATKYRELRVDEYRVMLEGVQQVIQPYMQRKLEVMQLTMPIITTTRTDTGYTLTTSYPPEVQDHFDRCDSMCEEAVAHYLHKWGYTIEDEDPTPFKIETMGLDLSDLKHMGR